ncbi:carbonic anhydrase [Cohaesibacter celericrescens]|uniref:Carbonic anhydrase n=1 Tax=Cohaesibacter celericrescens TaxID=2067669 RepID=A0A2N5XPN0_9HYPH|nr:carbonic anhydrase [Cohaesibacter celericrescens]PLW76378.1 carbonate dehydratase [Cohaesibacter celericrescens]
MPNLPTRLIKGYADFKNGRFETERARYEKLAELGQNPKIMVVGCCDSRAAPETIFDTGPGEIFVVRNVANFVPHASTQQTGVHGTTAALEFAVNGLEVDHIVVMGHGRCGGVKAYIEDDEPLTEGDYIGKWSGQLESVDNPIRFRALNRPDLDHCGLLERASVIQSMENLYSYRFIKERADKNLISLHGAWFDISSSELEYYDVDKGTFLKV